MAGLAPLLCVLSEPLVGTLVGSAGRKPEMTLIKKNNPPILVARFFHIIGNIMWDGGGEVLKKQYYSNSTYIKAIIELERRYLQKLFYCLP